MVTLRSVAIVITVVVAGCAPARKPVVAPRPAELGLHVTVASEERVAARVAMPANWLLLEVGPEYRVILRYPDVETALPAPEATIDLRLDQLEGREGRASQRVKTPTLGERPCQTEPDGYPCPRFAAGGLSESAKETPFLGYRVLMAAEGRVEPADLQRLLSRLYPSRDPEVFARSVAILLRRSVSPGWEYRVLELSP